MTTLQTVIIVIHLVIVLALICVVLLQRSEGGLGLGGGGGVSGFMTGRGQKNALTRTTAILAAGFFATSLLLTILAGHGSAPKSILGNGAGEGGNVLEQLQNLQGGKSKPVESAPPAEPVAPAVPRSQ